MFRVRLKEPKNAKPKCRSAMDINCGWRRYQSIFDWNSQLPDASSGASFSKLPHDATMTSPLTVKRRKLNDTLNKPFVSPLRKSNNNDAPLKQSNNDSNLPYQPYQPSTLAHTILAIPPVSTLSAVSKTQSINPAKSTPVRKQPNLSTSALKRSADPAEIAAHRGLTSLELRIRSIRNEIDTLKQAHQILNSTTDADLEDVATKWKLTSQSVAEEVFGSVKERVCRMGGVAAWRESEKKKYDRSNGLGEFAQEPEVDDDEDCEFDSQGEELPEDEQEWRKKEKARVKQEMKDSMELEAKDETGEDDRPGRTKVWQEAGNDDDVSDTTIHARALGTDFVTDLHDGYDASLPQHRARCHRIR